VLQKTKYARSDDVRIAYQITGDGPFDVATYCQIIVGDWQVLAVTGSST